ncbi:ComF family protein [Brevibacillus massiliensis]|uniref:ComF family protein n=1 Tax=Brevibacillus massiliensis TaxID=1118054 RepID=UPI0011C7D4B6|nr:ComF family protein [Brevibacillus massiliensis]
MNRLVSPRHYPQVFSLFNRLPLCVGCLAGLPFVGETICHRCGRNMSAASSDDPLLFCTDCRSFLAEVDPLTANRSALRYDEQVKAVVAAYKYRGDERLAELFAVLAASCYYRYYSGISFRLITYVPLHDKRLAERGFNQVELIAKGLGRMVGLPVLPLLRRIKYTEKLSIQSGRTARFASMQKAFAPGEGASQSFRLRRSGWLSRKTDRPKVLLLDDIFTTGATVRSCASAIKAIPDFADVEVYSLTLCR